MNIEFILIYLMTNSPIMPARSICLLTIFMAILQNNSIAQTNRKDPEVQKLQNNNALRQAQLSQDARNRSYPGVNKPVTRDNITPAKKYEEPATTPTVVKYNAIPVQRMQYTERRTEAYFTPYDFQKMEAMGANLNGKVIELKNDKNLYVIEAPDYSYGDISLYKLYTLVKQDGSTDNNYYGELKKIFHTNFNTYNGIDGRDVWKIEEQINNMGAGIILQSIKPHMAVDFTDQTVNLQGYKLDIGSRDSVFIVYYDKENNHWENGSVYIINTRVSPNSRLASKLFTYSLSDPKYSVGVSSDQIKQLNRTSPHGIPDVIWPRLERFVNEKTNRITVAESQQLKLIEDKKIAVAAKDPRTKEQKAHDDLEELKNNPDCAETARLYNSISAGGDYINSSICFKFFKNGVLIPYLSGYTVYTGTPDSFYIASQQDVPPKNGLYCFDVFLNDHKRWPISCVYEYQFSMWVADSQNKMLAKKLIDYGVKTNLEESLDQKLRKN